MPDDRLFHRRACHGDRSTSLNDLEYRVWTTYMLCADDYGVMRFSVSALRAGNDALEDRPAAVLERAFRRVLEVQLVHVFEHQGKHYVYQRDWQDWQSVRHPRQTVNPAPPAEHLTQCSGQQRELFLRHPAIISGIDPESSSSGSDLFQSLARAGTRETANGYRLTAQEIADFERFWVAYPNRKAKGAAIKAWSKLRPDSALVERILAAIEAQKRSPAWLKDGGEFIPHPSTWLNQSRWQDEVVSSPEKPEDRRGDAHLAMMEDAKRGRYDH